MLVGRPNLGIDGSRTEKVLSLANESDAGKTDIPIAISRAGKKSLTYNPGRDVSFIYTAKSVEHKSGITYSYHCHVGQTVQVMGYFKGRFATTVAHIIGVNVPLLLGQSRLNENIVLDIATLPGMSGSAVVDEQGNLLGMLTLTGAIKSSSGDVIASVALPTETIAKALVTLDPVVGPSIFRDIPEDTPEGKLTPGQKPAVSYQEKEDSFEEVLSVIPQLSAIPSDTPNAVTKLRVRAAAASERIVNVITKQCLTQSAQKALCHELTFVAGVQTFREIHSEGRLGKPSAAFPRQKLGVWVQSDWAETLGEIADNPWLFQGSLSGYYLFNFKSTAEDDRCYWEEYSAGTPLFGGGHPGWKGSVACFEWVLTDSDFNVRAAFTEMYPPENCPTQIIETAIYYDWVKLEGSAPPVLLPVSERISAKVSGQKKLLSAEVAWSDYKAFRADHIMKF